MYIFISRSIDSKRSIHRVTCAHTHVPLRERTSMDAWWSVKRREEKQPEASTTPPPETTTDNHRALARVDHTRTTRHPHANIEHVLACLAYRISPSLLSVSHARWERA